MTSTRVTTMQRLLAVLLVVVPTLFALDATSAPAVALAAIMLAALAILALCIAGALDLGAVTGTRRTFAWLTRGPTRQCDPDAAGHVRPRAPGNSTRAV